MLTSCGDYQHDTIIRVSADTQQKTVVTKAAFYGLDTAIIGNQILISFDEISTPSSMYEKTYVMTNYHPSVLSLIDAMEKHIEDNPWGDQYDLYEHCFNIARTNGWINSSIDIQPIYNFTEFLNFQYPDDYKPEENGF